MTRMINGFHLAVAITAIALQTAKAQTITVRSSSNAPMTLTAASAGMGRMVMIGSPVKDELLAGTEKFAQGATSVTEINLDPTTFSVMGNHGKDADLAHKMTLLVVHTYSYDKPGMYRQEDVDAFRKKLEDGSWSCYVHTRSQSGSSDICSRAGADHETNEMVIFTAKPEKLTFIHMSGKMSLEELSDMSGQASGLAPRYHVMAPMAPIPPMPPLREMPPAAPKAPTAPESPAPGPPQ